MAEKPKTLIDYDFYYPDRRSAGADAFASNPVTVDKEAGDEMHLLRDGTRELTYADGRSVTIPPHWLWMEMRVRTVTVPEA